jgi:hypothetical protein
MKTDVARDRVREVYGVGLPVWSLSQGAGWGIRPSVISATSALLERERLTQEEGVR